MYFVRSGEAGQIRTMIKKGKKEQEFISINANRDLELTRRELSSLIHWPCRVRRGLREDWCKHQLHPNFYTCNSTGAPSLCCGHAKEAQAFCKKSPHESVAKSLRAFPRETASRFPTLMKIMLPDECDFCLHFPLSLISLKFHQQEIKTSRACTPEATSHYTRCCFFHSLPLPFLF